MRAAYKITLVLTYAPHVLAAMRSEGVYGIMEGRGQYYHERAIYKTRSTRRRLPIIMPGGSKASFFLMFMMTSMWGGINFHKLESVQASTRRELSRIFNSFSLPLALNRVYLG